MQRVIERLWLEEDGFVLSTEMVMYGTLGVIGVGAGITALRDSVNSELGDVAKAIGALDQSYCFSPVWGHHAYTAGSAYYDRADFCDGPQYIPTPAVVDDRPVVCADVFGPGRRQDLSPVVPPAVSPLPVPDSLPGAGAAKQLVPAPVPQPSKGVIIHDPGPAMVAGGPGLVPVHGPMPGCSPVNVMVNAHRPGPYFVDVPEGYFNHGPGAFIGSPYYQMYFNGYGHTGPQNYGYAYAPAQQGVVETPVDWDTIDLGFAEVGDDELKSIDKFATAKCLHVLGSNVTDKGLGYIAKMQQLESLHLVGTQITDGGLKQLVALKKLRFLHLVGTRITDVGLASLAEMTQLEELDCRGTPVTDAGLEALTQKLPTLRVIR